MGRAESSSAAAAGQGVEAGGDDHARADQHLKIRHVAEDEPAEQQRPGDLRVLIGHDDGRGQGAGYRRAESGGS